ncbi:efflux transporter outer membrane subunit [Burkholderia sp. Ac-20353]|nr:efflux transporter outer membrane subunit [Burkholderia sp. Ac-20353]
MPDDNAAGASITEAAARGEPGDASQAQADAAWWKIYGDPQLDQLIERAAQVSPTMALAVARIDRAQAALGIVSSEDLPSMTANGAALVEHFPDRYTYSSQYAGKGGSSGRLTADAYYRLDFWGKRRESEAAARERVRAAQAEADDARLLLETAIVDAYVGLDAAYKVRDIATNAISRRQGVVDLLRLRAKAGLATDIDAVQARESVTETRSEIDRLTGEIGRRRNQIASLMGETPAFGDQIRRPKLALIGDPAPLSTIPATLLGYRPDIATARANVEAAAHEIGASKAAFYPDIDIVAFAGFKSLDLGQLMRPGSSALGLGPALTLPIFDNARLRSNLKQRTAEYDAAVLTYNQAVATALGQVANAIVTLRAERAQKREADEALDHWTHVVSLQKDRERQGLASGVDRLATETARLLSERRSAEADARIVLAQTALIRALGGAWRPSRPSHDSAPQSPVEPIALNTPRSTLSKISPYHE